MTATFGSINNKLSRQQLMINEMRKRLGLAQIVITHDMASVRRTADSVVVLHQGKVVQYGTPDVIEASSVPYVKQFVSGLTAPPEEASK